MTGLEKPNYTQVPNVLLDEYMPLMGEAELKVTLAIVRKIVGYHKEKPEAVSYSKLEELTGLSRQAVADGLKAALDRGLVAISGKGANGVNLFTLNFDDESTSSTSQESTSVTTQESTLATTSSQPIRLPVVNKMDSQKKTSKENTPKKTKQTPPPSLGITAGVVEGERSGDGGGSDKKAEENSSDPQPHGQVEGHEPGGTQNLVSAALPEDCKTFLGTLHGQLGERMRAMTPEMQLAWWYEVKDARNPAGLLVTRLREPAPSPSPGSLRKARSALTGPMELAQLITTATAIAEQAPQLAPDASLMELVPGSRVLVWSDIWFVVKSQLEAQLNSGTFGAFVKRAYAQSYADGVMTVCAHSEAAREFLEQRRPDLEAQAFRQAGQAMQFRFVLATPTPVVTEG